MEKTEMKNTVSLVTGSALSEFQRNLQRKTSVFKHHLYPTQQMGGLGPAIWKLPDFPVRTVGVM